VGALVVAGCHEETPLEVTADLAMPSCPTNCEACSVGEVCVSYWNIQFPAFAARCMKSCTDDRDCPNGYRCIVVVDAPDTGKPYPNACVSDSDPAPCGPAMGEICSDIVGEQCEGDTLIANGFGGSPNNLCGFERLNCPNGCDKLDAGADPFPAARCR
jgi:hypothetical protein